MIVIIESLNKMCFTKTSCGLRGSKLACFARCVHGVGHLHVACLSHLFLKDVEIVLLKDVKEVVAFLSE